MARSPIRHGWWLGAFLLLNASFARAAPQSDTWKIVPVSAMSKLTATALGKLEPFAARPAQLRAARGEWESFQVAVTAGATPLREVRVTATGLATHLGEYIPPSNVHLFRENYVFVDKPSGNRRLEKLWWPDALIPLDLQPVSELAAHRSIVFWIAVRTPVSSPPGQYYGALDITANGEQKQLFVSLKVEPLTLPAPTMRANVAVYYDVVRDWYAKNWKSLDEEQFARMKRQYYEFLLDYRINAYDLPVPWESDEAAAYLTDPRVLSVRLPPLDKPDFGEVVAALKRHKVLPKAYYYWIDEPAPERYAEIRTATQKLHAIDPLLKHCVTVHPNGTLDGAVDIWCPNIGDFFGLGHLDLTRLATERKKGKETWWYTMVEPKYPYPTWLLDDDAASVRIYGWLMARYGITGFVYSMAHGWGPKPLENLQSFAGTNGDGTLLYPSELVGGSGPMPSIRLMLLRDAIEDYEMLRALPEARRMAATAAITHPPAVLLRLNDNAAWVGDEHRNRLFRYAALKNRLPPELKPTDLSLDAVLQTIQKGEATTRAVLSIEAPPVVDGWIHEVLWNARTLYAPSFQSIAKTGIGPPDAVSMWAAHDGKSLFIAMRARLPKRDAGATPVNDWVAVELAPVESTDRRWPLEVFERWRFIVTQKGNTVIERHTREGRFRVEELAWKGATKTFNGFYDVEMKIPLSTIGNRTQFRLNALRRGGDSKSGNSYIVRAHLDAGDAMLMPIARLASREKDKREK